MALNEFLLCIMDSRTIFENLQLIFLSPLYSNFEFFCLHHKTVVIYMLFKKFR